MRVASVSSRPWSTTRCPSVAEARRTSSATSARARSCTRFATNRGSARTCSCRRRAQREGRVEEARRDGGRGPGDHARRARDHRGRDRAAVRSGRPRSLLGPRSPLGVVAEGEFWKLSDGALPTIAREHIAFILERARAEKLVVIATSSTASGSTSSSSRCRRRTSSASSNERSPTERRASVQRRARPRRALTLAARRARQPRAHLGARRRAEALLHHARRAAHRGSPAGVEPDARAHCRGRGVGGGRRREKRRARNNAALRSRGDLVARGPVRRSEARRDLEHPERHDRSRGRRQGERRPHRAAPAAQSLNSALKSPLERRRN